jgi:hypothetical protein
LPFPKAQDYTKLACDEGNQIRKIAPSEIGFVGEFATQNFEPLMSEMGQEQPKL